MRTNYLKATVRTAILAMTVLLLMAGVSSAQTVNLTASQQATTLSDGNPIPMWGWTCGTGAAAATGATCTALTYNPLTRLLNAQTGGTVWQPLLIVVPSAAGGANLTINLTNALPVETSIVIIGQVTASTSAGNGGLGAPVREAGPRTDGDHQTQTATTWTTVVPGNFTPPTQSARARSFVPEVAGVATFGATPAVRTYTWTGLKPGTYLMRTGTYPSIQAPMGLYGVLVVTQAPALGSPGIAYPAGSVGGAVTYDADVVALESETDARQNRAVQALFPASGAAGTSTANAGFSETAKWTPQCGAGLNGLTIKGATPTCYPPAVDYTPLYFLLNGVSFSKENQQLSILPVPAAGATGNILVRLVNAGSHMHVPSVNKLDALLVAEDGYVLPDVALALGANKLLTGKTTNPPSGLNLRTEVWQAAGKVMDVIVSPTQTVPGTYDSATYLIYDRSLSGLSADNARDGGMQALLDVNDAGAAKAILANATTAVNPDTYSYAPGVPLNVSDPGKGVMANDVNAYGVQVSTLPASGTLTLNANGTFTYVPTGSGTDHFGYCANGTTLISVPSYCTMVTLNVSSTVGTGPVANNDSYTSKSASLLRVGAPGVLLNDVDHNGYAMTAVLVSQPSGATVALNPDGSFTATVASPPSSAATYTFTYQAKNSQNSLSNVATVTLNFLAPSNLSVTVQDANTHVAITDYKWIIEQDLTMQVNPACQQNGLGGTKPATCPATVLTVATNFHTSYMPVVAEGCTGPQSCEKGQTVYDAGTPCMSAGVPAGCSPTAGQHVMAACDGYGICTVGASQLPASLPSTANLTATNPDGSPAVYYISILSGDAQNSFSYGNLKDPSGAGNCTPGLNGNPTTEPSGITENSACGHTMGGAPIPPGTCTGTAGTSSYSCTFAPVIVNLQPEPLKTATVTAWVFQDDYPLNGEPDAGGGVDVLATQEAGLGDFQIEIWDTAGGIGDNTGQMTYDMFNMPLTNSLNGTIDPNTGLDACPISNTTNNGQTVAVGVILVCPLYESDGKTPSPLTGQVVVRNLMQGKFTLIIHPGAAREANGEEWVQTNSLDGGHFLDAFIKPGEPAYFQEYGPGGYHVFFAMANPKIINDRLTAICTPSANNPPPAGTPYAPPCRNTVNGQVTSLHQGRSPSEQLYSSGVFPQGDARNYAMLAYTNCYASIGDSDGATIAFAKCDPNGNFSFTGLPDGNYGVVIFDQWDDIILDGSSRPANVTGGQTLNLEFPSFTWETHLWSRTYIDTQGKGTPNMLADGTLDPATSPGLIQVPTRIRQVNGKLLNTLLSDIGGNSRFDETFPAFAWYSVESDTTRFRGTGVHVVNDAGGPLDGPTAGSGNGNTGPYQGILNSQETFSVPAGLRVPGAVYCGSNDAACVSTNFANTPNGNTASAPVSGATSALSTGRIDPGSVTVESWQGGVSEFDMLDWGKTPYIDGETGGIRGHVVNATTRPFDDPRMLFQNLWEPLVPNVTINLYQEGFAADGTTPTLSLVDTTQTTSWDSWAQGFQADGRTPKMSCPGQDPVNDPYFGYTLAGTPSYLYPTLLPNNSQFKCYDGYHNLNQVQPAPYDGLFQFPSQACLAGSTFTVAGNATLYQCATVPNPAFGAVGQTGAAPKILPPGKYVTEVILPPGWQLNKEEDLNLLIGDQYIAPVTQQFVGLANIFITPDQASIDSINPSYTGPYTASNPYVQPFNCPTPTTCTLTPSTLNNGKESMDYGRSTFGDFGPGGLTTQSAPCVGLMRIVPDYLSIAPESGEISPFAGSLRPLCDRKEITLSNQMQADVDFFIYTHTPKTTNFIGFVSDDFSSEFDPASPSYGEKFAVPTVPVSIRDFNGNEVSRVYTDQFGTFNGLVYSTWEVDPPNITGYSPNVMITCMNDPGPIPGPNGTMIRDPYFNPAYSIFCYENAFMPGDTQYLDVPVVPVSAFADGYNPPDCAYPDGTPAIKEVHTSDGIGPWMSATGHTLFVTALGAVQVPNNAYSGPAATTAPYNLRTITRNYSFGATKGTVTLGGLTIDPASVSWSDTQISFSVPDTLPLCPVQTYAHRGSNAEERCGELVITKANGQQSVDTVTVVADGDPLAVHYVTGENAASNAIQTAIDTANPGDLIIVGPGTYNEMLLMWKPIRLQGVGAASTIIDANISPSGKLLEPWRRQVNCLFGLAINGGAISPQNPYDPNPNNPFLCPATMQAHVDRIQGEGVVGWDATLNGNLAELLQEPSLMGAYEGAAVTVLGKGVRIPAGVDPFGTGSEAAFPAGTVRLTGNGADCTDFPSNFLCNPSRIDGMSFTDSSQGGGGIWLHGWDHYTEVSNNRVYNNGGTLSGALTVGYPEIPDAVDGAIDGSSLIDANGDEQPYLINQNVSVHNNSFTLNASYGDELGSNTPASAGGVTFCSGADYYKFNYNWICGNLSSGNGGGFAHFGFSWNGDVEHNAFLFNQSINPTLTTYGGGAIFQGIGPDGFTLLGAECGSTTDIDCPPGLSDGVGPGLVINANLFQGNTAEEGSGGGLELQHVNGSDVQRNPSDSSHWYLISVTNNIFMNNVAGWTGGGVSLHDAVKVDFRNNTVVSNDNTASAGVLFDSLGAPGANQPPPGCDPVANPNCVGFQITSSNFLPAGFVTEAHTANFLAAFTNATVNCGGFGTTGTSSANPSQCAKFSVPVLANNIFWQNRAFKITTPPLGATSSAGPVQLVPALTQSATGGPATAGTPMYWDIGVYGDTLPNNHASGLTLSPTYSILDDPADYASGNNSAGVNNGTITTQYFNGSRVPPEIAPLLCTTPNGNANAPGCIQPGTVGLGITVPGGVPDTVPPPLPAFTLTPAATVDEGSNWINMFYGPLSLTNPTVQSGAAGYGAPLQNSTPAAGSPAIGAVPSTVGHPPTDFYGNPRPDLSDTTHFDIGAIEVAGAAPPVAAALTSISPNTGALGTSFTVTLTGTNLTGTGAVNISAGSAGITRTNLTVVNSTTVTATLTISATAAETVRNISVTTPAGVSNRVAFTVTGPAQKSRNFAAK